MDIQLHNLDKIMGWNRTIVELKVDDTCDIDVAANGWNRTIVELKVFSNV